MRPYEIFYAPWCPFCQTVVIAYPYRKDILWRNTDHPGVLDELIERGGKDQVPCLIVKGEIIIYETKEIIKYLNEHPEGDVE